MRYAALLARELAALGIRQLNEQYFDTVRFEVPGGVQAVGQIVKAAVAARMNLGYRRDGTIHVALDETVDAGDIAAIVSRLRGGCRRSEASPGRRTRLTRCRAGYL